MSVLRRLRAPLYGLFYRLPAETRHRLVRLLVRKYVLGAVVLVRDADARGAGRLLLVRQPPGSRWSLPAGLLQRREPPAAAAVRELAEETGVRLSPDDVRPAAPNAIVHDGGWVDMVFEATVPAERARLRVDGAEIIEAAWHPLDDLPTLTPATARLLGHYGLGPVAAAEPS